METPFVFDYFVRPEPNTFTFKTMACTPPSFCFVVDDDFPNSSVVTLSEFPELAQLYKWCADTLGLEYMDWLFQFFIHSQTHTQRDDTGARRRIRQAFVQVCMKNSADLALFKLRWSS